MSRSRPPLPPAPDSSDDGRSALQPAGSLAGRVPGLVTAFSTALPREPDAMLAPRTQTLVEQWLHPEPPAPALPRPLLLRQTHSPRVLYANGAMAQAAEASPAYDGAWSESGDGHLLAVKTADCVPLLAVDAARRRYAALHAGWRGTATGILEALLTAWRAAGSDLQDVWLELGPHIQGCCYEVQADCLAHFPAEDLTEAAVWRSDGRTHLHLAAVITHRAERAGIPVGQVTVSPHCTYCHRTSDGVAPYASYRRAGHAGMPFDTTNVAVIGVLEIGAEGRRER